MPSTRVVDRRMGSAEDVIRVSLCPVKIPATPLASEPEKIPVWILRRTMDTFIFNRITGTGIPNSQPVLSTPREFDCISLE